MEVEVWIWVFFFSDTWFNVINFFLSIVVTVSYKFWCVVFLFWFSSKYILIFLEISYLTNVLFSSLSDLQIFGEFPAIILLFIFSFIPLWTKSILNTSLLLNLLRCVTWLRIWSIWVSVLYEIEKNMHSDAVGWNILEVLIRSNWSVVLFSSTMCLLIFCLLELSILSIEGCWSL